MSGIDEMKTKKVRLARINRRRRLTPREVEVIEYRSSGFTTAEVGTILGISSNIVKSESGYAFKKLRASNLTQALMQCLKQGYFTINDLPQGGSNE